MYSIVFSNYVRFSIAIDICTGIRLRKFQETHILYWVISIFLTLGSGRKVSSQVRRALDINE